MTCHDARELFSALIDERLTREERADLYGHLATCADCRRELAAVERTVALVRGTTPARAPAGFVDRVAAAARPTPWHVRAARAVLLPWPVKLPLGAAAILLVGGLAVLMFRGTQEQQRAARYETTPPALTDRSVTAERAEPERAEQDRAAKSPDAQAAEPAAPAVPAAPAAPTPTARGDAPSTDRAESPRGEERNADAVPSGVEEAKKQAAPPAARDAAPVETFSGARAPAPPLAQSAPAEGREKSARAKLESLRSAAPSFAPPDVVARLVAPDANTAERALAALAARLAGAQTGRRVDGDALVVELAIPRARYPDFKREVARLGDYRPESESPNLPETIRVAVRLGS